MMHHFYPPRMKERERKREKELWWTKTKKVKGREEARLYRLGRHIEELWEEGPHPFAGSRLFMLRDSCGSTASQPPSPPASKTRGDRWIGGREGRERSGRRKFRTRIVWESKDWKSYDTFIVEMSRNSIKIEKMERRVFFFLFRVLIMEMKEEITNRDIGF